MRSELFNYINHYWRPVAFCLSVLCSLVVGKVSRLMLERASKHASACNKEWLGVFFKSLSKPVVLVVFTMFLWFGGRILDLEGGGNDILDAINKILAAVSVGYVLYSLVDGVDFYLSSIVKLSESKVDDILAPLVGKSIRITILVLVTLNVVQVVSGKNITTILAGLGVGGLAVALAGQDTIKNFFGSIVILGDKPFEIGDRVIIGGHDGPVESVGLRSTKIRTLAGDLVTVPNSEMVNTIIRNVGKRPYIKRVFTISVTYDTKPDNVKLAVEIIQNILANHEGMEQSLPPKVYFSGFGDWSLDIQVIYWYHPPDYWKYMEFSDSVNMEILSKFNDAGIEFAFPTQTVCLDKKV